MSAKNTIGKAGIDSVDIHAGAWQSTYDGKKDYTPNPKAIKLNNAAVDYNYNMRLKGQQEKGYKKTCKLLKKAIKLDPKYYGAYANLIHFARKNRDYTTALYYAEKYLKEVPDDSVTIYGLKGLILYSMGKGQEARKMFAMHNNVLERMYNDNHTPMVAMMRALYLIMAGERDKAISTISAEEVAKSCKNDDERSELAEYIAYIKATNADALVNSLE